MRSNIISSLDTLNSMNSIYENVLCQIQVHEMYNLKHPHTEHILLKSHIVAQVGKTMTYIARQEYHLQGEHNLPGFPTENIVRGDAQGWS